MITNIPSASSPFTAGLNRLSRHELPKQLDRIGAKGASNRDEFHDIDAALAAFIFGNKGLRSAKFFG